MTPFFKTLIFILCIIGAFTIVAFICYVCEVAIVHFMSIVHKYISDRAVYTRNRLSKLESRVKFLEKQNVKLQRENFILRENNRELEKKVKIVYRSSRLYTKDF